MFSRIQKVSRPDKITDRWDNYQDGMTILQTIEGENMTPLDIRFYAREGFVKLIPATEEEYQEGLDSWYRNNGQVNPTIEKLEQKSAAIAKKLEAKETREAAKIAKKIAAAEAKAAMDAQREAKAIAKSEARAAARKVAKEAA